MLISLIPRLCALFAVLCVVALPLWILGVPGQPDSESNYVRGWKMGLGVVMVYPVIWALNFLPPLALRGLLSAANQAKWHEISGWIGALSLAAALVRLGWALKILSKGG